MQNDQPFISTLKPKYKGYCVSSYYIETKDGTKIATDVLIPAPSQINQKFTSILIQTRYWRAIALKKPFNRLVKFSTNPLICKGMVKYGYIIVTVDVRGTGASYGTQKYPVSETEVSDGRAIIDWIVSQPWSNGSVVTWGNSYSGMTSELAATLNHSALKCVLTKHNPWDLYLNAMFPGGVFNQAFIGYWSNLGKNLDQTKGWALIAFKPFEPLMGTLGPKLVKGVKPVVDDEKILEEVATIHSNNNYPIDYGTIVTFRDDKANEDGTSVDSISTFTKREKIEKLNIPLYTWGSWQDSATADFVISRFMTYKNPIKAIIGDWDHIALKKANPYYSHKVKVKPTKKEQVKEWIDFYEKCIAGAAPEKALYYYTMGEEKWKKVTNWPPQGQKTMKWYLNEKNALTVTEPENPDGKDEYKVNFEATTGIRNRWYTLLSLHIFYPNREEEDSKCLIYTSAPLENDLEITGHPIVSLYLSSTHSDGMIHAHLEFLDEKNVIHWVTDGQLRFIHRKISTETPPYNIFVPYHSYKNKDNWPLIPGEVAEIKFGMYPTSILLRKGFKLRLVIAGADKDSFARYPKEDNPTLTIERNNNHPSLLELPIIQKTI